MTRTALLSLGLLCLLCVPVVGDPPIPAADVLIVADESGSMTAAHFAWLANTIAALETDYAAAGVGPNRYRLAGYATNLVPGSVAHFGIHGDWMDAASMVTNINTTLVAVGDTEDGYEAIQFGMTNAGFRPGAFKTVILITDEDRDVIDPVTRAQICQLLRGEDTTLNTVVDADFETASVPDVLGVKWDGTAYIPTGGGNYVTAPGGYFTTGFGTTKVDYVELSWALCSASFDLDQHANNGPEMTNAFTDVKIEELTPIVETLSSKACSNWILAMGCVFWDGGQNCWFWFDYRDLGSLSWKQTPLSYPAPQEGSIFMEYITDLQPDTWYQFRARLQNSVRGDAGAVWSVKTHPPGEDCPLTTTNNPVGCDTCCDDCS